MSNIYMLICDPYDRRARLSPALLAVLPVVFLFISLFPNAQAVWTSLSGVAVYCGCTMLMVQLGRSRGKSLEPELFRAWDGKPSVAMLRHCDTRLVQATKDRYRAFLERNVPELRFASPEQEKKCPTQADDGYESATNWLLTQTRDRERFRLIFEENINYGFRRNITGLKPLAVLTDILVVAILLAWFSFLWTSEFLSTLNSMGIYAQINGILVIFHLIVFLFVVTRDWIRIPAEAYARQLLAACDDLSQS